jgi:hypothetical protein
MDIREKLSLGSYPFDLMPQSLIDLVFQPDRHSTLEYLDELGISDPSTYQALGESVLKMIMTRFIFTAIPHSFQEGLPIYSTAPGELTHYRNLLLQDNTLFCLAMERGIVVGNVPKYLVAITMKRLVGLVYYYLDGIRRFKNSFEIAYEWFSQVWNLDRLWRELGGKLSCKEEREYPIRYRLPPPIRIKLSNLWGKADKTAQPFISSPRLCREASIRPNKTYREATVTMRKNRITSCTIDSEVKR